MALIPLCWRKKAHKSGGSDAFPPLCVNNRITQMEIKETIQQTQEAHKFLRGKPLQCEGEKPRGYKAHSQIFHYQQFGVYNWFCSSLDNTRGLPHQETTLLDYTTTITKEKGGFIEIMESSHQMIFLIPSKKPLEITLNKSWSCG